MSSQSPELKMDWIGYKAAKYACVHWHYSKCIPTPPIVAIGAWENGHYIGCVLFSRGASKWLGHRYGLTITEICELTRIAMKEHKTPISRMIAIAVRMLKKKEKNLRLIVSFSDQNENHHGGIYQAANWIYTGETNKSVAYMYKGHRYHNRSVTRNGLVKHFDRYMRGPKIDDCESISLLPKHRYLMPLDDDMRKQIEPLRKPYPKREKQAIGSHPEHSGGAAPTLTLQNINKETN